MLDMYKKNNSEEPSSEVYKIPNALSRQLGHAAIAGPDREISFDDGREVHYKRKINLYKKEIVSHDYNIDTNKHELV